MILTINVEKELNSVITIGRVAENEVTQIDFNFSAWQSEFGQGETVLAALRSGDKNAYPIPLQITGNIASFVITDVETARAGRGVFQLTYYVGEKVKKSAYFKFVCGSSLRIEDETPDPYDNLIETLMEIAAQTEASATTAQGYAQASEASATASAASATSSAQSAAQAEQAKQDVLNNRSDWTEEESDSLAFIEHRPAIRSGDGTNCIIEGSVTGSNANETSGSYAHAEGFKTHATENYSHAEGYATRATNSYAHAEGQASNASGTHSHAEGQASKAQGNWSHAEGYFSEASGQKSHAEGNYTKASGSISHAEGASTTASGQSSHAEGNGTTASGDSAHAEGYMASAKGYFSHAEGSNTETVQAATNAHVEGKGTTATHPEQHVQGKYNAPDYIHAYAHVVGNGVDITHKSNCHTLDWDGNAWFSGNVSVNGTPTNDKDLVTKKWVNDQGFLKEQENADWAETDSTEPSYIANKPSLKSGTGSNSIIEGGNNIASGAYSHAEGLTTNATGSYAHAEGISTYSQGQASHAEGYNTTASASYAHAEGMMSVAEGIASHSEGEESQATGDYAHAEGHYTTASGDKSHAEGWETNASNTGAHAEGYYTVAYGEYSHAEGNNTIASAEAQHVEGKFNIEDTNETYAHIVGNGTSDETRSNAHTVDWSGNAWFAGNVSIDGTPTNDNDLITKGWVEEQGYLTEHQSLDGYATEAWVEEQGYLTEHQSLDGYATEEYVDDAVDDLEEKHDTDISAVNDKLLNAFPVDTATGPVASFTDGAELPLKSLVVNIEPVQDLHGYDNPWPAGGSTNLLGGSLLLANSQNYLPNGTTNEEEEYFSFSSGATVDNDYKFSTGVTFKENTQYTFIFTLYKTSGTGSNMRIYYTDDSYNAIPQVSAAETKETVTITSSAGKTVKHLSKTNSSGTTRIYYNECGVFEGAVSTDNFVPYENICPITGWTGMNLSKNGENLWRDEWYTTGNVLSLITDPDNIYYGYYYGSIRNWALAYSVFTKNLFRYGVDRLKVSADVGNKTDGSGVFVFRIYFYYADGTSSNSGNLSVSANGKARITSTSTSGKKCVGFQIQTTAGANNNQGRIKNIMVSVNGVSDYIAPFNVLITIPFGQTVYGGTLDVLDGVLTVTDANIISYNGETLPGEWISDRDVYEEGTTPTTGAQVVYKLAEPITVQLDAHEISSLLGSNNFFADTGDTSVTYRADPTLYISKKIAEAISALS